MTPQSDTLQFLFASVATIVATLTGLIGAFSTFRLQNIDTEITFLKGLVLGKKITDNKTIADYLKGDKYHLVEEIYDPNLAGVELLRNVVLDNHLDVHLNELLIDIDNIKRNQLLHEDFKFITIKGFKTSLSFVFVSLLMLVFTPALSIFGHYLWWLLFIYIVSVAYVLILFVKQLAKLMY